MTTADTLRDLGEGLLDLFFPPTCVHCGGVVEPEKNYRYLCADCERELHFVEAPACGCCGHPFFGQVDGERICPHCEGLDPAFERGVTTLLFKGAARSLLISLKYHRQQHLLSDFRALFQSSERVLNHVRGAILVPVPLHPRKQRERGFNQSVLLAVELARAAGADTRVLELLRRVEDTGTQTALDRHSRMENLRDAFSLSAAVQMPGKEERLVLLDDVFTTGSTLNCCARVLRKAGFRRLDVVSFAHG